MLRSLLEECYSHSIINRHYIILITILYLLAEKCDTIIYTIHKICCTLLLSIAIAQQAVGINEINYARSLCGSRAINAMHPQQYVVQFCFGLPAMQCSPRIARG